MKTTIRRLRSLIREALQDDGSMVMGSHEELDHSISAMDPDTISTRDYVDGDTGEIYLEKGDEARTSRLHPQYHDDRAARRAAEHAKWEAEIAAEEAELGVEPDVEEPWDGYDKAKAEFDAAVTSFAESCKDYSSDLTSDENDLEGIMPDLAESFFVQNPEWKQWAKALDMDRTDMKSYVASMAYEAASQ